MPDISGIMNEYHPGVLARFALTEEAIAPTRDLHAWRPFCGGWIVVQDGRALPAEADVLAKDAEFEALKAQRTATAKWAGVREERNARLTATDWTQVADAQLTEAQKSAWATYRQALRAVPQTQSDPDAVVWPNKPE